MGAEEPTWPPARGPRYRGGRSAGGLPLEGRAWEPAVHERFPGGRGPPRSLHEQGALGRLSVRATIGPRRPLTSSAVGCSVRSGVTPSPNLPSVGNSGGEA